MIKLYTKKFNLSLTQFPVKISLGFSCLIHPQLFQIQLSAYTLPNFHSLEFFLPIRLWNSLPESIKSIILNKY